MHIVARLRLAGHRTFRSKTRGKILTTTHLNQLYSQTRSIGVFCGHTTYYKGLRTKQRKTFNLLAFNMTWKWRQYNAHKFHAYFEGYGNENGRSWAHVYLKTHLFTPEKLYFTKIKNKKKLRSEAILRSGGDAKQVYIFLSGLINFPEATAVPRPPFPSLPLSPPPPSERLRSAKTSAQRFIDLGSGKPFGLGTLSVHFQNGTNFGLLGYPWGKFYCGSCLE